MAIPSGTLGNEKFRTEIRRASKNDLSAPETDVLAVEEPLEIRLGFSEKGRLVHKAISITMRTPGADFDLAAGFLFTEGILRNKDQIASIYHCGKFPNNQNTIRVDLIPQTKVNIAKLARNFYTTSSCGVCGKSSLKALATGAKPLKQIELPKISHELIHEFPAVLLKNQTVFDQTGGLHAAALFDAKGKLLNVNEDVGRHNAVDKLIGRAFLTGDLPLNDKVLFLSGRASFELVQKAVMAQIPIIAAVGAPSSLAVQAANEFGVTLLGFVRDERFNVYTGSERVSRER